MVFDILFYTSLAIFIFGLIFKASTWFTRKIGICAYQVTPAERLSAAAKGILVTVFSPKFSGALYYLWGCMLWKQ
jgi:hypothetical protein